MKDKHPDKPDRETEATPGAEAPMERGERIAQVLMNFAPDIIYQLDESGRIQFVNPAVAALGWKPEELIGRNVCELIEVAANQSESLRKIMTQRTGDRATRNLRIRLKSKQGESLPFDVRDVCFALCARGIWDVPDREITRPDKAFQGTLGIARDITAQVNMESALRTAYADVQQRIEQKTRELLDANAALRKQSERMKLLFDNAADAIFIHNIAGSFLEVNQTALDRLGYTREAMLKMSPFEIDSEAFQPLVHDRIKELVEKGSRIFETAHIAKDGHVIDVECSSRIIEYNGDTAVLTIARDISEKKATQKRQEQLEADLRHVQKMDAIGTVAGCVAHDINNRLTVITGYVDLMLEEENLSDGMLRDLNEIRKAAERSVSLARQLLTFARKEETVPVVLDTGEVLQSMQPFLRGLLPENIELAGAPFPEGLMVKADQGQVEQVVMNLVVNARDAMPAGGRITLRIDRLAVAAPRCIGVQNPAAGPFVRLSVEDEGGGVPDDLKYKVFEPFFTTKATDEGTGLGLAIVYGIARGHGGWVDVRNGAEGGAVFHVYLPAFAKVKNAADDTDAGLDKAAGAGERILLVEDEEQLLRCSAKVLARNGYQVQAAANAMEAMKQFASHGGQFDLVLSDVVLPDFPADELLERIRLLHPEMPFLFVSGYSPDRSDVVRKLSTTQPFLPKPYDTKDLLVRIREVLRAQAAQQ